MAGKTNCCRIIDTMHINYTLLEYEWDEDSLDAVSVALKINMPTDQVFKTLVLCGDILPYFVIIIQGDQEVSLKKAAKATGNKSCFMLPLKELQPLTGYIRGGCSAIGMKKQLPTFLEETALLFDQISVSAGLRGLQMLIHPLDLAKATSAVLVDLL